MRRIITIIIVVAFALNGVAPGYLSTRIALAGGDALRPMSVKIMKSGLDVNHVSLNVTIHGPILVVNLLDISAEIVEKENSDGTKSVEVVYQDTLAKVRQLLEIIKEQHFPIDTLYLHGLLDISGISRKIHGNNWKNGKEIFSAGNATIRAGYNTKSATRSYKDAQIELRENQGNHFSTYGQLEINQSLAKDELKSLIDEAHKMGIKVIGDFIAWFSPDAITDENHHWFLYKELSGDEQDMSDKELLKRHGDKYFILRTDSSERQKRILVRLRDCSSDQARPNIFNHKLQKYYKEALRFWIDLGLDGFRVDLANELITSYYQANCRELLSQKELQPKKDPIVKELFYKAKRYARSKYKKEILFLLEAYMPGDRAYFNSLGHITYYPDVFEKYRDLSFSGKRSNDYLYQALRWVLKNRLEEGRGTSLCAIYASNYDEDALRSMQGPEEAFMGLVMALSILNVPVIVGMREWMGNFNGELVPVVGGNQLNGKFLTHCYVTQDELEKRATFSQLKELMKRSPWGRILKDIDTKALPAENCQARLLDSMNTRWLIPLAWTTRNGDTAILIADLRQSGEPISAWVDQVDKIKIISLPNTWRLLIIKNGFKDAERVEVQNIRVNIAIGAEA